MRRLATAMVESGYCTPSDIVGCTPAEIAEMTASAEFTLPDEYLAFLQVLGRNPGTLFQGRAIPFPASLEAREVAQDIAEDEEESLTLDCKFFFGHHQGYIVYFVEEGSPGVFLYQEGHPDVLKLADSFTQWLWESYERSRTIRADGERLEREAERKREQMRAEGKL
ncbi:SMI1/KNR4 family protein [Nocardia sp. NEAU-G5]|uniref:SMI1/KNR4 family protein n=1 Tax=Nocardia albiluteola TaxID=2842303 RepID=A0ABS6AYK9_9NOCA|nr:SMI1/KNR4 family protein [Nocardia albiluteola]MBU3063127.1 SMI1/KNR4 family protein [Nocardia albiluteola]